jgi:tRNA pseudouridine(38-40) synthase
MRIYCHHLTGEHDYSAFVQKQSRRESSNVLVVESFDYETLEEKVEAAPVLVVRFHVIAKGFRRGMVRNLVGFVVDLCRGHVSESVFESIWTGADEVARLVHSAPPFGLCLEHVEYQS